MQPPKVQVYVVKPAPAENPMDMDLQQVECISSGSATTTTVEPQGSEPMLSAQDQEKGSIETNVIGDSSKGEVKQVPLPSLSSSTSDEVLDESVHESESPVIDTPV